LPYLDLLKPELSANGMKKLLLITFDYELFLGSRSGKVKECIIDPTYKLLEILKRYEFKAIFFVDTVYLLRLQEIADNYPKAQEDKKAIFDQLTTIVRQGHYIFPHIHPHWLDAEYLEDLNEWSLDNTRYYKFSSLSNEKQKEVFDASVRVIQTITCQIGQDIPLDAYRAGGWSIQPFEYFKPHFEKHGIRHEFSVIPGRYQRSEAHYYDFREAPTQRPVYRFREDVCITDDQGPFTEWTISVMPISNLGQWFDFSISGLLHRLRLAGRYKGNTLVPLQRIEGDVYDNENNTRHIASFEGLNPLRIALYLSLIRKNQYFQFISHPKLLSKFELNMIKILFWSIGRKSSMETDFRKANYA
jgi:peptidoglycan/xylan/chitin deacetylase (PgdA/CDA1 family)